MKPILIVEDEIALRESLRDWLVDGGYLVETAPDGEEALRLVDEQDFGVVLLDLRLPGIDGIQVLREARKKRPELKVIIITAYPSVNSAVSAIKEGAIDYLPKPFDLNDLEKLINGHLEPEPGEIGQQLVSGEAIARLAVRKQAVGMSLQLVGWDYIDAYLNHGQ
jgi:two-component system response regulator AtoC